MLRVCENLLSIKCLTEYNSDGKTNHHKSKDPDKNNNWDYSPLTFGVKSISILLLIVDPKGEHI